MLTRQYLGETSVFQKHSRTRLFFIYDQGKVAGRFALIVDQKLPDCVQLAFFEALEGLKQPVEAITSLAAELFPSCSKLVAGLNGHLNHQSGILLNHYHEPPLFRRPYAPPWYAGYFSAFTPGRYSLSGFLSHPSRNISGMPKIVSGTGSPPASCANALSDTSWQGTPA